MAEKAVDSKGLHTALEQTMKARKVTSWRALSVKLGVSPSTFTRLKRGENPDVDTYATLVGWLGVEAGEFMKTDSSESKKGDENVPVQVLSLLRSSKNLTRDEASALNEMFAAAYKNIVGKKGK